MPNLLLQPLVENAIRHGIACRADAGRLELHARRVDHRLRIEVLNDGGMVPADFDFADAAGIGLRNTASRLAHHYGTDASVRLENRAHGMVAAIVRCHGGHDPHAHRR